MDHVEQAIITIGVVMVLFGASELIIDAYLRDSWSEWLLRAAVAMAIIAAAVTIMTSRATGRDLGQWGNNDPAISEWYRSLMQPDIPTASCCGEADAYYCDDYRGTPDGRAFCTISDDRPDAPRHRPHVDVGTVIEIPSYKLKYDRGNPTGHGIVFLSTTGHVYCYVQSGGV